MGELGLNKIFGALLATALGVFALQTLSSIVFSGEGDGAHHGEEHAEPASMTEKMCEKFAYCVEVADAGGTGGEEEEAGGKETARAQVLLATSYVLPGASKSQT